MKKGFIRTLEAFIAGGISFMVLFYIIQANTPAETRRDITPILGNMLHDDGFRLCAANENTTCISELISPLMGPARDHIINITSDASQAPAGLPDKRVDVETLYISGNGTSYDPKIVRLYSWVR
ncbi:MAG: hypothetical protein KJ709_06605 [Nanoarchaeota archaeon]|nr:hypothetical protein [Nanoarchaeota archaeon]